MNRPKLRVDHIGIAVENLAEARVRFEKLLGTPASPIEEVPTEHVRVSFFDLDGCRIELLEATGPASPVRKFLDRGRSGVHHVSLTLESGEIGEQFSELARRGVRVIGSGPIEGSEDTEVFFVHPSAAEGVLIEISQHGKKAKRNEGQE